jgi:AcrR family transcriptional regulator
VRPTRDMDDARSQRPFQQAAAAPPVPESARDGDTGVGRSPLGGRATRKEILDVAAHLLVSQGLAELSVESLASRAQVESSLIARWWPSEDALALDTLRHVWLGVAVRVHDGAAQVVL